MKKKSKKKNKQPKIALSKIDKADAIIESRKKFTNKNDTTTTKANIKEKTNKKFVFKETEDVILISVDRNWLARRSHELNKVIAENNFKDPKMQDGNKLAQTLKCQGANEQILEILEKFENI